MMVRHARLLSISCFLLPLLLWMPGCQGPRGESTSPGASGSGASIGSGATILPDQATTAPVQADDRPEISPVVGWMEEGYRTVFSFLDNRHLLHNYDTGLFINFGHPSALKYVRGRFDGTHWQEGSVEEGRPVAWTDGVRSVFLFPLHQIREDLELVVRMRANEDQRMDVFLNGERVRSTLTDLPTEWSEVRIPLPSRHLVVGENRIRFHFARTDQTRDHGRTAGGFDWARVQAPGSDPLPAHRAGAFEMVQREDGRFALTTPVYGTRALYLTVPPGARLRTWVAVDPTGSEVPEIPAAIRLHLDGGEPLVLWEGSVTSSPQPVEISLDGWTDQVGRLELAGQGPVVEGRLQWIDPRLVVVERQARTLDEVTRPRQILIWLVDALRPDHFRVYHPDTRVEAPSFVEFADQCLLFRRATAQGNTSLPSAGSILTSTYQVVHRITQPGRELSRDLSVVAQPFEQAGWATALFSSNGYVNEGRGFARGSQVYRNLIHEPGRAHTERLWPIAREWIDEQAATPWFAFVWTIDPHVPYDPPEDILARYYTGTYTGSIQPRATGTLLDQLGTRRLEGDDLRYLVALYDGEITYNDLWFGHMLEDLRTRQLLEDTLVVVLADHGEGFFEHGRAGHGTSVFEEQVYVPLMFCHPRSLGESRWIDTEVETIDLFPTLLELFGLDIPASVQGIPLVDLLLDPTPVMNRPGFSYHQDFMRGLRIGRWKYVMSEDESLYDLVESPIEGQNRIDEYPIVHRYMTDVMAFHLAYADQWRKTEWGHANNHTATLADRLDSSTW